MVLEGLDRHGDGQIGLAGAGRADGERDVVLADALHIACLAGRAGADSLGRVDHVDGGDVGDFLAGQAGQNVRDLLPLDAAPLGELRIELVEGFCGLGDRPFFPSHSYFPVPMQNRDPQGLADGPQMLVPRPEQRKDPLRVVQHDRCFCHSAAGGLLPPDLMP